MPTDAFDLFLFTTDPTLARRAIAGGINGIVVDWERQGKWARQAGADTQINHDTPDDLTRIRRATTGRVLCRINGPGDTTPTEVETAIARGADEILLPMVRAPKEVAAALDLIRGRCGLGILIETTAAVARAEDFVALPLTRVYIGLNDLGIERGTNLFQAVGDGTVERVRASVRVPFGFGGLTLPDRGYPIPCRLLMGEMVRLGCEFSFLRRSFHRDTLGRVMAEAIADIRAGLVRARERTPATAARDRAELMERIGHWDLLRAAHR